MPRLNCNAGQCQYNCKNNCTRNTIHVGDCYKNGTRQVECKSYKTGFCLLEEEFAKDITPNELSSIQISCDSNDCVYNKNHMCTVSKVEIKEPTTHCECVNAECTTYKKRV